jgi:hypothetical protein
MDRTAITSGLNGIAFVRGVEGSRPMGSVTNLSNVRRGTLQGGYIPVNRV